MGKMSELAVELSELRHCGEVLIGLSESIAALLSTEEAPSELKLSKKKKVEETTEPKSITLSEYTTSKEELLRWANEVLAPTAQLAANGDGEFKAGEHCRFCKVRTTCRKLAEYNLSLARYDFEPPATLDNLEIAAVLAKADELISWVTDVKEYALRQALSGVTYDGFKVVEGRSNRKYTDENAVVNAVEAAGFDPYEHNVLGITAMTALLGKKKFNELLGGLVEKPQGKPTLVPMSDKRPAIHTANEDFKEDN